VDDRLVPQVLQLLDKECPKLSELDLAIAINTCRKAGAVNAANALSKHITRLTIELTYYTRDKQ